MALQRAICTAIEGLRPNDGRGKASLDYPSKKTAEKRRSQDSRDRVPSNNTMHTGYPYDLHRGHGLLGDLP